jgi:hypothetical protein
MAKKKLKETAAGGSTGGGAIAAVPSRMGFKSHLIDFYASKKKKFEMKPVALMAPITEFYDLSDVVSRLKGVEGANAKKDDTVTYGVEDDDGNIMKVSVKKDQAKDFEYKLARDMADAKDNKLSGATVNVSLAELLYNLKDEFNIVDVEFPTIPKDVIYMADKASYGPDTSQNKEDDDISGDDFGNDEDVDVSDDNMDIQDDGSDIDVNDENIDIEGGEGLEGEEGEEGEEGLEGEEEEGDDESVEDFTEEEQSSTPESLLKSVMDMLKADADAKKAQADATAEEARAKQAEYAYKSAQATVAHEEEFARMEADADEQKQKEKEAKRYADLAKHRVQRVSSMRESKNTSSILSQVIMEIDDYDTVQTINRDRAVLRQKYKPMIGDDNETVQYKQSLLQTAMAELNQRLRAVKLRDVHAKNAALKDKTQQTDQQNNASQRLSSANTSGNRGGMSGGTAGGMR